MSATKKQLQRQDVWGRYWSSGVLHSCAGSFDDNYDGAILDFWRASFEPLDARDAVLDIGTGNGALPRLLLELKEVDLPEVHAVDLAMLQPEWLERESAPVQSRIHFRGRTAAESLPFPDASFSLVVSQYGLEYSRLEESIPEISRVLRPGGRVALITHHVESVVVHLSRAERDHCDWLLVESGLLDQARSMVRFMARARTPQGLDALRNNASANQIRQRYNRGMAELAARAAVSECPDLLHDVRLSLAQTLEAARQAGADAALQQVERLQHSLADARVRLDEAVRYALDAERVQALCGALQAGRRVQSTQAQPLLYKSRLMGWAITAA